MSPLKLSFTLSWRFLSRDLRSGELTLLAVALLIAVGGVTAVGFFTDRIQRGMEIHSNALLAADLAIGSPYTIAPHHRLDAKNSGLRAVDIVSFRSVISWGDKFQLSEVKAVDPGYPLRGELRNAPRPFAKDSPSTTIPRPGTAWAHADLLQRLDAEVGARLSVGSVDLEITRVLTYEPDRGGDLINIAPRLLINRADLAATGLIMPGSRVHYRLLLAGHPDDITSFRDGLATRLHGNERIISVRDARPELNSALKRAEQYLGLAALSAVLLSGIAIAMAARRFTARHLDGCAVLRCLGASSRQITMIFVLELCWLGLLAASIGCIIGYCAQALLVTLIGNMIPGALPQPSWIPVARGMLTGIAALIGFALPPILRLKNVPPARVLRHDLGPKARSNFAVMLCAMLAILPLAPWDAGAQHITAYLLAGAVAALAALGLAGWLLVTVLGMLRQRVGVAWRYGLANITRHAGGSVAQIAALGLGLMVMLVLTLVRTDLFESWRASLPPDAHDHFLVNVQAGERAAIRRFFVANGLDEPTLYPMVRCQLVAVNGQSIHDAHIHDDHTRRHLRTTFNVSFAATLPPDNDLKAGRWWDDTTAAEGQFSVEEGIAKTLHVKLGDTLLFQIADQRISGKITSLRTVDWDSFKANFYIITPPTMLKEMPTTYLTSFYLGSRDASPLAALVKQFPAVTVVDIAAIIKHVREIMDRANLAVEFVFLFTLAAGICVLFAAIQATLDQRLRDAAILRTLGARNRTLLASLAAEFASLGLVAGIVASLGAVVLGLVLADKIFRVEYVIDGWIFVAGPVAGIFGIGLAGLLGTRRILRCAPVTVLRDI